MKEKVNKIVFVITVVIIIVGNLWFSLHKPISFSEQENRYLQMFPKLSLKKLVGGKLTSDIEDYINDQFPMRDTLVGIKTNVEIMLGKRKINDIYIAKDDYLIPAFNKNNDSNLIIKALNEFVREVEIPIDLLIAPNAIEIYSDKLPINDEIDNGIEEINNIYQNFDGKEIDVHNLFLNIKDGVDLYYRTDHHWTTYGAFYAYNQYLARIGKPSKKITDYNIELASNQFYGTSYSKANYYSIKPDEVYLFNDSNNYRVKYVVENKIESTLYNRDYLDKKDKYSIFLDNNHALIEIDNLNNNSGENLLVIKNSYGNSFVPFVAADFDTVTVADLRYYSGRLSEYAKCNNISRVLVLYDINGIYTDASILKLR